MPDPLDYASPDSRREELPPSEIVSRIILAIAALLALFIGLLVLAARAGLITD